MSAVSVVKPGLLTTVQDRGRCGFQALGVSVAGPMDPVSHRLANAIAGNLGDAATLEVTSIGPELIFEDERRVAIAGAQFEIFLDGQSIPSTGGFVVAAGSTLRFGPRIRGTRAYLAVAGGIETPRVLGSRATHLPSAMGGFSGRALKAGDRLPCGLARQRAAPTTASHALLAAAATVLPDGRARLRVLPGPQTERFAKGALDALQSGPYKIASNSNRMGFRLEGPRLVHANGADVISDATPLGVVQVPASGQPILLMADRQTTGGYAKLATVITADIGVAGQLGPGDAVVFDVCSLRDAMAALIAQEQHLMSAEAAFSTGLGMRFGPAAQDGRQ
jgi:antagonist of KipI